MNVEFDHLFICASAGAPEVAQLLKLGFTEGERNVHPGQGTSCRRVFFHNAYLEFIWVHEEQEARSELVKPMRLWERWQYQRTGYSPFGLGLRSIRRANEQIELPFETWAYRPPYLPAPLQITVAENSTHTAEPLAFLVPVGSRPDMYPAERIQPLKHDAGAKEISALKITLPAPRSISPALGAIAQVGIAKFIAGEAHLAEVIFDHEQQGKVADFRPSLPLVFRW